MLRAAAHAAGCVQSKIAATLRMKTANVVRGRGRLCPFRAATLDSAIANSVYMGVYPPKKLPLKRSYVHKHVVCRIGTWGNSCTESLRQHA